MLALGRTLAVEVCSLTPHMITDYTTMTDGPSPQARGADGPATKMNLTEQSKEGCHRTTLTETCIQCCKERTRGCGEAPRGSPQVGQGKSFRLSWWDSGQESAGQCRGHRFHPCSRKTLYSAEQLNQCTTAKPMLHNERSYHNEKPTESREE